MSTITIAGGDQAAFLALGENYRLCLELVEE